MRPSYECRRIIWRRIGYELRGGKQTLMLNSVHSRHIFRTRRVCGDESGGVSDRDNAPGTEVRLWNEGSVLLIAVTLH